MTTAVFEGCNSNSACSVHRNVLAKVRAEVMDQGLYSIASLPLCANVSV